MISRLVSGKDINRELALRRQIYLYESVNLNKPQLIAEMISEGWEQEREYKTTAKLRRLKSLDVQCEDRVWTLFALMGFKVMNKDRNFHIPYNLKENLTQQIDVFAKDDETILIVECKSAEKLKQGDFKKDLEATAGQMEGLQKSIRALFPDENLKFKYILATKNFWLGDHDKERLKNINGDHLDEDAVDYYLNLYKHLGTAARYQLLGSLFHGQDIKGMDNKIPAIRGKMGNHEYYSFSIEPEKLLKISYVLHRSKVNSELMPTYQRLIKKQRIAKVLEFIDEKAGYFANSIVISLDTDGKELQFDRANTQVSTTLTTIGVLHLPKKYRSAFIIDGQHRLYGYSNSKYKNTNAIPVVAFLDLDRSEQVKLFMEINENQKAVPKNLRTTLNADLLWSSDSFIDQHKALCSRIALYLGESKKSPLYSLISIGEDKKIITTDAITRALSDSGFLGKVSKTKIETLGTFYKGDLKAAYNNLSDYIICCLGYIKESLDIMWFEPNTLITINKGIYSLISILSDVIDHLLREGLIDSATSPKEMFDESKRFLNPIIDFYKTIDEKTSEDLRGRYGQSGDVAYWRRLQKEVREAIPRFTPPGLDEYEKKESKEYNEEAYSTIRDIEQRLNSRFKELLFENFGEGWFEEGVPPQIQDDAVKLAQQKKREKHTDVHPWECINVIDYRTIALRNWQSIFADVVTLPDEKSLSGGKDAKTQWLNKVGKIRNQNMHSYYVTKDELEFLKSIRDYICS
ncbi:MAG TPA: DGQHR domain-containing protein [Patescibacteria group bacterium]|nr:DGQHR domain-containing protein [Patescibacteria group bacterium]